MFWQDDSRHKKKNNAYSFPTSEPSLLRIKDLCPESLRTNLAGIPDTRRASDLRNFFFVVSFFEESGNQKERGQFGKHPALVWEVGPRRRNVALLIKLSFSVCISKQTHPRDIYLDRRWRRKSAPSVTRPPDNVFITAGKNLRFFTLTKAINAHLLLLNFSHSNQAEYLRVYIDE